MVTGMCPSLCDSFSARWWAKENRNGMFHHGLYTKRGLDAGRQNNLVSRVVPIRMLTIT